MQDTAVAEIIRKWELVATRADDEDRDLFVATRADVSLVLRDLIADGARMVPTDPTTLAILAGEAILDLRIADAAQRRIVVQMWPTPPQAIGTTMVEQQAGDKRLRIWTFRQDDKYALTVFHDRAAEASREEKERQEFALELAHRAGWPIPAR